MREAVYYQNGKWRNLLQDDIIDEQKRARGVCNLRRAQEARERAQREWEAANVCCGYVLPLTKICPECGKNHNKR